MDKETQVRWLTEEGWFEGTKDKLCPSLEYQREICKVGVPVEVAVQIQDIMQSFMRDAYPDR